LTQLASTATIAVKPTSNFASEELVRSLVESNAEMIVCLNRTFRAAVGANQQGIANFIAERIDQHQKWNWQLTASL
jgi:DNA-binding ferritin-like protein